MGHALLVDGACHVIVDPHVHQDSVEISFKEYALQARQISIRAPSVGYRLKSGGGSNLPRCNCLKTQMSSQDDLFHIVSTCWIFRSPSRTYYHVCVCVFVCVSWIGPRVVQLFFCFFRVMESWSKLCSEWLWMHAVIVHWKGMVIYLLRIYYLQTHSHTHHSLMNSSCFLLCGSWFPPGVLGSDVTWPGLGCAVQREAVAGLQTSAATGKRRAQDAWLRKMQ